MTRAGFQLVEQENPGTCPEADAVLITLSNIDQRPLVDFITPGTGVEPVPPRLVVLSGSNPDAPAAALALGAADALVAPVHLPELCARLYARIREHRQPGWPARGAELPKPVTDPVVLALLNGRTPGAGVPELPESKRQLEALDRRVQEEFARARRYSLSFSLILLGVDDLPGAEERIGAEAANRLRCAVGGMLRRELRTPDFIVPYGSGEFAIVLPETGQIGARQSFIRVRERLVTLPFEGDPRLERSRFSAGIVTYPHPAAFETGDLFAMAEAALMRGKGQAGERIGVAV